MRTLLWHLPNVVPDPKNPIKFRFIDFEHPVAQGVQRYINTLKGHGLNDEFYVGLSLLKMKGFRMDFGAV